eukprot:comp5653_c0_seq1/m.1547 comp5653_c0_seq1/g.1547  ORF comp5653_c0_seq1/g.1547 comp5653_c0_seq1/m.1547 type:complete len:330 (-) comp5653_c0_seq1:24-1013(-)
MALRVRNGPAMQLQDENAVENPRRTKGEAGSNMFTPQHAGKQQLKTPGNNKAEGRKFGFEIGNRTFGADLTNKNSHMSTSGKGQQGESTAHKDKFKKLLQTTSAPTIKTETKTLLADDPALSEWPSRFHFDNIPEESEPVTLQHDYPMQDTITSAVPIHLLPPSAPVYDPPGLFEISPFPRPTQPDADMGLNMDIGVFSFSLGPTVQETETEVFEQIDEGGDFGEECRFTQDPDQGTDPDLGASIRSYLDPYMSDLTRTLSLSSVGGELDFTGQLVPKTIEREHVGLHWTLDGSAYDALLQELARGVSDLCVLPEGKLDLPFFTVDIVC